MATHGRILVRTLPMGRVGYFRLLVSSNGVIRKNERSLVVRKQELRDSDAPPQSAGVDASWVKQADTAIPSWAEDFFAEVEREGLAARLVKRRTPDQSDES